MIVYFDSSALVKLVVKEESSDIAVALWNDCDLAVTSRLAYPEVRAALAAARRARRLTAPGLRRAEERWGEYWSAVRPIELTAGVAARAGDLAGEHSLHGADAVHLASASVIETDLLFAVWDRRLHDGARRAGLTPVPSELG